MGGLLVRVDGIELPASWMAANPNLRRAIERSMPLSVAARRWGAELYGSVPIEVEPVETETRVAPGTLAYWPAGKAVCLFWGPTPASDGGTPVAASPVAPFASVDDIGPLRGHEGDATLTIERR